MEDIIDIIVTETTNLIEITSQPTDEIIDVNIIDNREDITLNVTPTVVEININSLTSNFGVEWGDITGTLADQTDLQNVLNLKADLVDGKVPSSQLPSYVDDVVEVATFSALPATGEVGKIYVILDTNKIYRWSGSTYIEIADSTAVWGAITGTLSSQTDLQSALDAKVPYTGATANVDLGWFSLAAEYLKVQTGTTHSTSVGEIVWNAIDGTFDMGLLNGVTLQSGQELHFYGKASGAIGNGQAVMFAGVEGDHLLMSLADATTINANPQYFIGVATQDFANNDFGYITVLGKVRGLNTSALTQGAVLYYDSSSVTDGLLTHTVPTAPNAKIEVAVVVRVHATQGVLMVRPHIMPKISMLSDVHVSSIANNDLLTWVTNRFENKSIATILGYTPQAQLNGTGFVKISGTTISYDNSTYLTTSSATSTYLPLTGGTLTGGLNGTFGNFSSYVNAQTIDLSNSTASNALRITHTNGSYHAVSIIATGNSALYASGSVTVIGTIQATSTIIAQAGFSNGVGQSFTLPSTTGTLALTSQLSSYLPLSGGTLTGALSGTSATFSGKVLTTASGNDTFGFQMYKSGSSTTIAGFYQNTTGDGLIAAYNSAGTQNVQIATNGVSYFNGGNVGIGTTAPNGKLDVLNAGDAYVNILSTNPSTSTVLSMFNTSGTTDGAAIGYNTAMRFGTITGANAAGFTERMRITSGGNVGIGTTAPTNGKLEVQQTDTTAGLWVQTGGTSYSHIIADFRTGTNASVLNIRGNGTVGIGNNSSTVRLFVGGSGNTSAASAFIAGDSGGNTLFQVRNDGNIGTGLQGASPYNNTSASSANLVVFTDGTLGRSTSSLKYKTNVQNYSKGLTEIMQMRAVTYEGKGQVDSGKTFAGLIAEEVHDLGLTEFVQYAEDGTPDALSYQNMVSLLVKGMQELKAELDTLKNK